MRNLGEASRCRPCSLESPSARSPLIPMYWLCLIPPSKSSSPAGWAALLQHPRQVPSTGWRVARTENGVSVPSGATRISPSGCDLLFPGSNEVEKYLGVPTAAGVPWTGTPLLPLGDVSLDVSAILRWRTIRCCLPDQVGVPRMTRG